MLWFKKQQPKGHDGEPSRTWPSCSSGPCKRGLAPCPTPTACRVILSDDADPVPEARGVLVAVLPGLVLVILGALAYWLWKWAA